MEREQISEAWVDEVVSLHLGDGDSVSGTLKEVNDRGIVVYVSSTYLSHKPVRHLFLTNSSYYSTGKANSKGRRWV